MDSQTLNLTTLICDSLNNIFFKLFSSINNTIYSTLDDVLFIRSDIMQDSNFKQLFGTDATNGLLLIANSLIWGILLFYVFRFSLSHLTYSKIDSPYQFIFKCIIFIACMNSSFWICEKIIDFIALLSDSICELGTSLTGQNINFSNLISKINSTLYPSLETFDIFSFNGILKMISSFGILYILLSFCVRYVFCKILILLAPFAFISLISNHLDGFFKGWLKQFLILLFIQIVISLVLVLGFILEFHTENPLSKLIYLAIIMLVAKCNYHVKSLLVHIYQSSQNKLKNFI